MKIVVTGGGTGGHIYPALAIIKYFEKKEKDLEVLYIGTHNRMENDIIPKFNIPFKSLEIYGFSKDLKRNFKNIKCVIKAYYECIKILKEFKPDVVIGVGGYVTLPVIMAGKKLNINTYLHEQNSIPGKANKFLSKGVTKVFVSMKGSIKHFKNASVVYSGNPSGDNVTNLKPITKEELGLDKNKKLVVITSGSLGSSALNDKLIDFLKLSNGKDYQVLMITGKNNYDNVLKRGNYESNIKILPYLNNLAALFKNSDVVISRAGASTIAELLASKTPSILIPSPYVANNHQYYNALELSDAKCAIMIEENNLDSNKLYKIVNDLLTNKTYYQSFKNNINKFSNLEASKIIYEEIKKDLK